MRRRRSDLALQRRSKASQTVDVKIGRRRQRRGPQFPRGDAPEAIDIDRTIMDAQSKRTRDRPRSIAGNSHAGDQDIEMLGRLLSGSSAGCGGYVHEGGSFDWRLVPRRFVEIIIGGTMRQVNPPHSALPVPNTAAGGIAAGASRRKP